jgi:hypothetical protein
MSPKISLDNADSHNKLADCGGVWFLFNARRAVYVSKPVEYQDFGRESRKNDATSNEHSLQSNEVKQPVTFRQRFAKQRAVVEPGGGFEPP